MAVQSAPIRYTVGMADAVIAAGIVHGLFGANVPMLIVCGALTYY